MFRTDLAIEKNKDKTAFSKEEKSGGIKVYKSKENAEKHITVTFEKTSLLNHAETIEKALIEALNFILPKRENILVAGLGNTEITPDAIGPAVASKLLATRHIAGEFSREIGLGNLKKVSIITPSVLGKTGIETAEIISAAAGIVKPDAVILIDALAAGNIERLFRTIQLSNTGISPGSGVKNSRKEISEKTLFVPTVAIGVPTVIDIGKDYFKEEEMIVTPKDVDLLCEQLSGIISRALNFFLQPEIDKEIITNLV